MMLFYGRMRTISFPKKIRGIVLSLSLFLLHRHPSIDPSHVPIFALEHNHNIKSIEINPRLCVRLEQNTLAE